MTDRESGAGTTIEAASGRLARRRPSWTLALALAALAVAACGRGGDGAEAGARTGGGGGGPGERPTAAVEVAPVTLGSIARSVSVSGVVEPIRTIGVNSQLSGSLLAVNVEEGSVVRRGAVLARLDDRELRAQLAAAQANYDVAEAAYQRAEQLRERQVITLPEFERERTAYAAARAQLDQLRTRIGFATITAPIDGVVTAKHVEAGDVVAPQTRLFSVADISIPVVRVGVSELDVVELRIGETARVAFDAFPGRAFDARIRRIFPSADPSTRLVPVEVALTGEGASFARPGFLARVTFALGMREDVLLVPASALVRGAGSEAVFVVQDDRAVRRSVETGLTSQGRVEIVSGLSEDDVVVTAGAGTLRDGMEVRVVGRSGPAAELAGEDR